MDNTRRSFLGGALTMTAAALIPLNALEAALVPTIYGDGVTDDWAGLQAAADGRMFRIVGEGVVRNEGGRVEIYGGNFMLSRGIILRGDDCRITRSVFRTTDDFPSDHSVITMRGDRNVMTDITVIGSGPGFRLSTDDHPYTYHGRASLASR